MPVHFGHGGVDFLQLHVELLVLRHEQLYLLLEVEYSLTTCCTSSAIGGFQLLKIGLSPLNFSSSTESDSTNIFSPKRLKRFGSALRQLQQSGHALPEGPI